MAGIAYRPEIDGLRAIAVVPVILFHLGNGWFPGGYLGVDVFFVISGFLITSLILKECSDHTFSLRRFWSRRIRRILPALLTMLVVTSAVGAAFCFKPDTVHYGEQGAAAAFSVANIVLLLQVSDYWSAVAQETPFLHTWSLSVEEQFYFFYPPILLALYRYNRRLLPACLLLVLLISFLLSVYGARTAGLTTATFYLLPTRTWELATGCLLADWISKKSSITPVRVINSAAALIGLSAIIMSYFVFSRNWHFQGYIAVPVFGSALLIATAPGTFIQRILATPILVPIGKISYSLYLWHWPVIVLGARLGLDHEHVLDQLLTVVLILLFALLSYQYVERPARFQVRPKTAILACLLLLMSCLGLSAYLHYRPNTYNTSRYHCAYKGRPFDVKPEFTAGGSTPPNNYETGGIIKAYGASTPEIMVMGDSHGAMWSSIIDRYAEEQKISVSFYSAGGTNPFFTLPLKIRPRMTNRFSAQQLLLYDQKRIEFLETWRPKVVVLAVRWDRYSVEQAHDLIETCGKNGARVLLIEQPPLLFIGERKAVQYLAYLGISPKPETKRYLSVTSTKQYEQGRNVVRSLCERYPFCQLVEVADIFLLPEGKAWVLDGSDVLYWDGNHLSQEGAERAAHRIGEGILAAMPAP